MLACWGRFDNCSGLVDTSREPRDAITPHIVSFDQIYKLWHNPAVINFDSTIGLVPSRTADFERLIDLTFLAMQKTNKLFVSANFMTGFMYKPFKRYRKDPKAVYELYETWLSKLMSQIVHSGMEIEFYDQARHNRRKVSTSSMIGFYALITKK
jgi:hypothetical protein